MASAKRKTVSSAKLQPSNSTAFRCLVVGVAARIAEKAANGLSVIGDGSVRRTSRRRISRRPKLVLGRGVY